MIRVGLIALAVTIGAQPASALSCLRPDLARSFKDARASDELYSIVLGQFRFGPLPPFEDGSAPSSTRVAAQFNGRALGPDGFNRSISRDVTFVVSCAAGVWCGSAGRPGDRVLAFLRHDGDGLVLDLEPCPQWVFADPSSAQIELVAECLTGGNCD